MHCYFCDQLSPEGSLFCKPCGSPFHLAPCPRCAAVNALTVVSCYKCKAILPIRRAETKEVATNDTKFKPATEHTTDESADEPVSDVPALEVATAHELTQSNLGSAKSSPAAKVEEPPVVSDALPVDTDDGYQKTVQLERSPVEVQDENYQKTIALQGAPMDVNDVGYQKTIPVRRPMEKVHDEDYQKTFALQRASMSAPENAPEPLPAGAYDVNYQKTIALQRAPVDVHNEAYVKTISTRHPPKSLVGGAVHKVAATEGGSLSTAPTDLQAEYAALQSIDVMQKAKWGQRALLASAALLLIVAGAYFFLRSQQKAETSTATVDTPPDQLQTEALAKLPATAPGKVLELLPFNVKPDAAGMATNQAPKKIEAQTPSTPIVRAPQPLALPAKTVATAAAKPSAPTNQQTKAAPNDRVLLMPPDATKLSAAATAAAIAAALGKDAAVQPANKADATKLKPEVLMPAPENIPRKSDAAKDAEKNTANPAPASQPPVPCTEALAALGLCVLQPATPKP
jgi:hypothetical protein